MIFAVIVTVGEIYVENPKMISNRNGKLFTENVYEFYFIHTLLVKKNPDQIYPQKFIHISHPPVDKLQACVNVGGDVTNIVLQGGILVFKAGLHLADGIQDGCVILIEFLADVGKTHVG